ncbi:MAG TPA: bifunctional metallophosphatase/5'-nucleotidase [Flavisolibacter sp.]|jgi:2',3'-cyclic-nucleotide 2'-phosphodiesterase (5'-nucleotidase family)|nr:bifunctional metallophosphatase/5'-nucleotidase [Flavisolibacter sp.]
MTRSCFFLLAGSLIMATSCSVNRKATGGDHRIDLTFVQVNDVYEIAPLSNGREGGLARIATLKKQYLQKNPNTFLVIAGDFVSPSVYNSLQYEGKAIRGKQMIESLNAAGMDLAVFGNHEFDIKEGELQDRINESRFEYMATNVFHQLKGKTEPFYQNGKPLPLTYVLPIRDADGTTAKIGFIGLTLPFNKADYVSYTDALATAKNLYNKLKDSVDAVVAITHQSIEDDKKLADEVPGLAVILGGHEHDMRFVQENHIYITKAHANAKSAYVVNLHLNLRRKKIKVKPQLVYLNDAIPLDSATNVVVQKWVGIAEKNYSSLGFDAHKVVLTDGAPLDGRETEVRSHATTLTQLIVRAMSAAAPEADIVLLNGGSIRVDDVLQMPVTQYDIIRSLPFGGSIRQADLKGSLLIRVLNTGQTNVGTGGFLHYSTQLVKEGTTWKWNGAPVDPAKTYRVAMPDFLLTGKEANMDFLNPDNPEVVKVYEPVKSVSDPLSDIRQAVVQYLEHGKR